MRIFRKPSSKRAVFVQLSEGLFNRPAEKASPEIPIFGYELWRAALILDNNRIPFQTH